MIRKRRPCKIHGFVHALVRTLARRSRFSMQLHRDACILRGVVMITWGGHNYPGGVVYNAD